MTNIYTVIGGHGVRGSLVLATLTVKVYLTAKIANEVVILYNS